MATSGSRAWWCSASPIGSERLVGADHGAWNFQSSLLFYCRGGRIRSRHPRAARSEPRHFPLAGVLFSVRHGMSCHHKPPPAYSPTKTRAVPAVIRPMLRALLVCPMRFSVRVSPITMKPAKVKMFMPNRISLVSISPPFVPAVLRRAQGVRDSKLQRVGWRNTSAKPREGSDAGLGDISTPRPDPARQARSDPIHAAGQQYVTRARYLRDLASGPDRLSERSG